jgi:allene oxide cyclase-like protein
MGRGRPPRTIGGMNKKLLSLLAIPVLAFAATTAHADKHGNGGDFKLTGKVLGFTEVDLGDAGDSVGDQQLFTMDVFQGTKRLGESHVVCTKVRIDATGSIAQCENVTSLPGGQITASGAVTSADEETRPFVQAITGGTGAYKQAHGQLTVSEAGPQPATLTFDLS